MLEDRSNPVYLKDYSRLLYAAGKKDEAVSYMSQYISLKDVKDDKAVENIEKMKKGEYVYWWKRSPQPPNKPTNQNPNKLTA